MKTILVAVMASFLFMGQTCSTTDIPGVISTVQKDAAIACGFVPAIETVAAILATGNAALGTAAAIAAAICAAVRAAPTASGEPVKVGGVVVQGYFVNRAVGR